MLIFRMKVWTLSVALALAIAGCHALPVPEDSSVTNEAKAEEPADPVSQ